MRCEAASFGGPVRNMFDIWIWDLWLYGAAAALT
jgi:hypothetical protein